MRRRLKEDWNIHYNDLGCPCRSDPKAMARFREQPKRCSCRADYNLRSLFGPRIQERRQERVDTVEIDLDDWWREHMGTG
jgi:hypothetical protein